MDSKNVKQLIRESNFFGSIGETQLTELSSFATIKRASQGQFFAINQSGQRRFFIVMHGMFKILEVSDSGQEWLKFVAFKGDFFGGIVGNDANDYGHVISKNALLICIDYADFMNMLARHQELFNNYQRKLEDKIKDLQGWYYQMMRMDVKSRLWFFLTQLANKEGARSGQSVHIDRTLTQEEMASAIFTSRQSIVRSLNGLILEGKIRYDKKSFELIQPNHSKLAMAE